MDKRENPLFLSGLNRLAIQHWPITKWETGEGIDSWLSGSGGGRIWQAAVWEGGAAGQGGPQRSGATILSHGRGGGSPETALCGEATWWRKLAVVGRR
jgi:hypothetical protein